MGSIIRTTFLLVVLSALLSGCFDDSDNDPNVSLDEISSLDANSYSLGEPFSVDFTITSHRIDANNVGVAFYLIEASKVDQLTNSEEAEAVEIGEYHIESLSDGTHTYTADLVISNTLTTSGRYVLVANIDSAGTIEGDTKPEDDQSRDFNSNDELTFATLQIDLDYHHDFVLSRLETGNGYLLVPDAQEHNSSETGVPDTLQSDIIGFIYARKYGTNEVTTDISAEITLNGIDYDVHFWDHINKQYADAVPITFPSVDTDYYFPFDIALNGELVHALNEAFDETLDENTFTLSLSINTLGSGEVDLSNNDLSIEVPFFIFDADTDPTTTVSKTNSDAESTTLESVKESSSTYIYYNQYVAVYGDSDSVAILIDFDDQFTIEKKDYSADFSLDASVTGYLFDESFSIISATADADISASTLDGGYDYQFSVLGETLIDGDDTIYNFDESMSESWDEEVTLVETTFTIVIVPVTLEAGISGSLGIGASLTADEGVISATGSLVSAEIDAYAEASIDLGIASGGVTAELLIFSEELTLTAEADLTNFVLDGEVDININLENELKAIEGEFSVFVSYTSYKWCCSFPTKTKTYTIYETDALYDKTWNMMDYNQTINF